MANNFDSGRSVRKFQEYLRIRSDHPNPDQESAVKFLNEYAIELDIEVENVDVGEKRSTVVLMKLEGRDPALPSLVLNSHWDVVPAYKDHWKHDPFSGFKEENGDIYGRGAQDMKNVAVQYLETIRILKLQNCRLERTIYLTFMPNEEIGGESGMKPFLETPQFKAMNPGLILDEGLAHPENKYSVFYGERHMWWCQVKCEGNPGHGSRFIENTAAEKLRHVINRFLDFRAKEEKRLKDGKCLLLGDVTTTNLTMLSGGVQPNVVPDNFQATFDIRIPPSVDIVAFENQIKTWCEEAGKDVSYGFVHKTAGNLIETDGNLWWEAVTSTLTDMGIEFVKEIFPAGTDSKYLRDLGYPAIGFSPMRNTPILLHDHNEFLNEKIFLEGINVYCKLVKVLANLKP